MEECLGELRGLEDGYRQKHRDAKQVTNHNLLLTAHEQGFRHKSNL